MSRQDQSLVTLNVDGQNCGVWDTLGGGGTESEETKYRAGGMAAQVSLGGYTSVENVTLARLFVIGRDDGLIKFLRARCGAGNATVVDQPLDADGNVFGQRESYTGKLMRCTPREVDSNSADEARYEVEISTNATVA